MARARAVASVGVVMAAIMTAFGLLFCLRVIARRELKEVF
jgi:hypothetical protein